MEARRAMMRGGIVAVHAHPDDESITMGATLARYAAMGVPVTLVTATLGEQGELMHGRLGGLDADHADQLGGYRFGELHGACRAMGVADQRMLGGLGRFRDSGMAGEPSADHPRALIHAQRGGERHEDAVGLLVDILRERQPDAVLTYDATGGYGHPDHIAAHQITVAAFERWVGSAGMTPGPAASQCLAASQRPVVLPRLAEVIRPRSVLVAALESLWTASLPHGYRRPDITDLGTLAADGDPDVTIPVGPWRAARRRAMAAHATQLDVWAGAVDGFALTNLYAQPLLDAEYFRVLAGPPAPPHAADLLAEGPRSCTT